MNRLHHDNRLRAAEATRRDRERHLLKEETSRREQQQRIDNMNEHHRTAAARMAASSATDFLPFSDSLSRKRKELCPYASPQTGQQHVDKRRCTPVSRMVWKAKDGVSNSQDSKESFIDIALREGTQKVYLPPRNLAADAMRDGRTIRMSDGIFQTMEGDDTWYYSQPWAKMVSTIVCKTSSNGNRKLNITGDSSLDIQYIGSGTYNIVVGLAKEAVPEWLTQEDVVYRITRPNSDKSPAGSEETCRYQTIDVASKEADNAMFASVNKFGVRVHSIASFHGVTDGRTLRYGTVYALDRANLDLFRYLEKYKTFEAGALAGVEVTELIFKASRCGVAFFDIKPANILSIAPRKEEAGYFCLTDYDPAFFIRLPDEDWRTLMLLNLALLTGHVRNMAITSSNGFCAAVAPVLRQLVHRRHELHNSDWLFGVRSVRVPFEMPESRGDFHMQRMFAVMATSYFYNLDNPKSTLSSKYRWEFKDQSLLDSYWCMPKNRLSWPPQWQGQQFKPLIEQLVDFAVHLK